MTDKFNRTHGSTGTEPPDGKEFQQDERPDESHFDWFWYNVHTKINSLIDDITDIVNGNTTVQSATNAANVTSTYKGNDIDSNGDGTVDNADKLDGEQLRTVSPSGIIAMWGGSTSSVPNGWTLCDGNDPRTNSSAVPDLRNRFVTGAGDEYAVGDTGGSDEVQLTVDEMPSHNHTYTRVPNRGRGDETSGSISDSQIDDTTGNTGGDEPHENRPRFYAIAYIYKL